jgi:hypothetical protein
VARPHQPAAAEIEWCLRSGASASEPRKHLVDLGLELVEAVAGVVRLLRRSCAARHYSDVR